MIQTTIDWPETAGRAERNVVLRHIMAAVDSGLPAPHTIRFNVELGSIDLGVDGAKEIAAWGDLIPLTVRQQPHPLAEPFEYWATHSSSNEPWHGWGVWVSASDPITEDNRRWWVTSGGAARHSEPKVEA